MAIKQMISTAVLWLVTTISKLRVGFVLFAQVYSAVIRRSRCSQIHFVYLLRILSFQFLPSLQEERLHGMLTSSQLFLRSIEWLM